MERNENLQLQMLTGYKFGDSWISARRIGKQQPERAAL